MNGIGVTGADGFIGTHLCLELATQGMPPTRILFTPTVPDVPLTQSSERYFNLEIPTSITGCLEGIHTVYHLAALARQQSNHTEEDYQSINVEGTRLLLDEAVRARVKRFVFVSSIEAAGPAQNGIPLDEETPPCPENAYGRSKRTAEELVLARNGQGIETTVVRLPMIYGPGNYLNVPKLFQAVKYPLFPLFGDGRVAMEFCYVGNAVHGLILAGTRPEAAGQVFFISDNTRNLREIILAVAKAQDRTPLLLPIPIPLAWLIALAVEGLACILPFRPFRSPITHKPLITRKTVLWTTRPVNICSIQKARRVLGYQPTISLEEGIAKTTSDFRSRSWI